MVADKEGMIGGGNAAVVIAFGTEDETEGLDVAFGSKTTAEVSARGAAALSGLEVGADS